MYGVIKDSAVMDCEMSSNASHDFDKPFVKDMPQVDVDMPAAAHDGGGGNGDRFRLAPEQRPRVLAEHLNKDAFVELLRDIKDTVEGIMYRGDDESVNVPTKYAETFQFVIDCLQFLSAYDTMDGAEKLVLQRKYATILQLTNSWQAFCIQNTNQMINLVYIMDDFPSPETPFWKGDPLPTMNETHQIGNADEDDMTALMFNVSLDSAGSVFGGGHV